MPTYSAGSAMTVSCNSLASSTTLWAKAVAQGTLGMSRNARIISAVANSITDDGTNTASAALLYAQSNSSLLAPSTAQFTTSLQQISAYATAFGQPLTLSALYTGAGAFVTTNGVYGPSSFVTTNTFNIDYLCIGCEVTNSTNNWNGGIFEIIVSNVAPTPRQQLQIDQDQEVFYGVSLGHVLSHISVAPELVYSLRIAKSGYTGPLINAQRLSDNAKMDIYADATGFLDLVAVNTFCSGSTLAVMIWYDQSIQADHAIATSTTLAPTICSNGYINYNPAGFPNIFYVANPASVGPFQALAPSVVHVSQYFSVVFSPDAAMTGSDGVFGSNNSANGFEMTSNTVLRLVGTGEQILVGMVNTTTLQGLNQASVLFVTYPSLTFGVIGGFQWANNRPFQGGFMEFFVWLASAPPTAADQFFLYNSQKFAFGTF